MGPECLLGVVPQPTDSRLRETRAALPQIRVETLIGFQANYEIKIQIMIYIYKTPISYEKYSTLNTQKLAVVYKNRNYGKINQYP